MTDQKKGDVVMAETEKKKYGMKDLKAADPRWCTGCGDYTILVGVRKFMVDYQIEPKDTVHVSGIGCSGRMPHYMNTYGIHSVHGRAVPFATGVSLANENLKIFIHSGDGDSISIGGNHLIHGIHKNFNCVYLLFDNQIYGLTKQQSSPTTRVGLPTMSQPQGTQIEPINPLTLALGAGATFVASTAEWMNKHMVDTIEAAYNHKGFAFVHVAQRCPKFNPRAWNYQDNSWVQFIEHENGIKADARASKGATIKTHDPSDLGQAYVMAQETPNIFGLFYQTERQDYAKLVRDRTKDIPKKDPSKLLDAYSIH